MASTATDTAALDRSRLAELEAMERAQALRHEEATRDLAAKFKALERTVGPKTRPLVARARSQHSADRERDAENHRKSMAFYARLRQRLAPAPVAAPARSAPRARGAGRPAGRRVRRSTRAGPPGDPDEPEPADSRPPDGPTSGGPS